MPPRPGHNQSSLFAGHESRVASHLRRIREHVHEHPEDDGNKRPDTGDTHEQDQPTTSH